MTPFIEPGKAAVITYRSVPEGVTVRFLVERTGEGVYEQRFVLSEDAGELVAQLNAIFLLGFNVGRGNV